MRVTADRPACSLLAAHLPELGEQRVVLVFEVLASLLADRLRLFIVAWGEVRLEHCPPAVVELRPFLAAEQGRDSVPQNLQKN